MDHAYLRSLGLLALCLAACESRQPQMELSINQHTLTVEIADSAEGYSQGLRHRSSLPENHGLWLILKGSSAFCVGMRDTPLPLTAAFMDDNNVIVELVDLQPNDTEPTCAHEAVHSVLEMSRGWFTQHQVVIGARVRRSSAANQP